KQAAPRLHRPVPGQGLAAKGCRDRGVLCGWCAGIATARLGAIRVAGEAWDRGGFRCCRASAGREWAGSRGPAGGPGAAQRDPGRALEGRPRGRSLRAVAITRDNIPLSEPIAHADVAALTTNPGPDARTDPMVLHFIEAATAPNTRRAYDSDLRHFLAWGASLPASADVVARYLAAHATIHAVATLARHLVAIRRAHALRGLPDPVRSELV